MKRQKCIYCGEMFTVSECKAHIVSQHPVHDRMKWPLAFIEVEIKEPVRTRYWEPVEASLILKDGQEALKQTHDRAEALGLEIETETFVDPHIGGSGAALSTGLSGARAGERLIASFPVREAEDDSFPGLVQAPSTPDRTMLPDPVPIVPLEQLSTEELQRLRDLEDAEFERELNRIARNGPAVYDAPDGVTKTEGADGSLRAGNEQDRDDGGEGVSTIPHSFESDGGEYARDLIDPSSFPI